MAALYVQGPPKRVRVTLRTEDGATFTASLATRHARDGAARLLQAIDEAEADKIAARGLPTQKQKRPKRTSKRSITRARPMRAPSRLKRIESAAITLQAALSVSQGVPPEILEALRALDQALGKSGARKIAPTGGGFSR